MRLLVIIFHVVDQWGKLVVYIVDFCESLNCSDWFKPVCWRTYDIVLVENILETVL